MSNNPYTTYGRTSNHAYTPTATPTISSTNNSSHGYNSSGLVLTSNGIWAKSYNSTWSSGLNLSDDPFYRKEPEPDTLLENKYKTQELSEVLKPRRTTR